MISAAMIFYCLFFSLEDSNELIPVNDVPPINIFLHYYAISVKIISDNNKINKQTNDQTMPV